MIDELASTLAFTIPSSVVILFALKALFGSSPVRSILALMMCFVGVAGMGLMVGAEFIPLLLVAIYVGAVLILCLFVVMMMDYRILPIKQRITKEWPLSLVVGLFFAALGTIALLQNTSTFIYAKNSTLGQSSDISGLGELIYGQYFIELQALGVLLIVAVVGAVILTGEYLIKKPRQPLAKNQLSRTSKEAMELVKVEIGSGVKY